MKVLVTGGTRGIGAAIAKKFVEDGFNCTVTGTRTKSKSNRPSGTDFFEADFSRLADIHSLAEHIKSVGFDIVVNNAGINIKGPTDEFAEEDYDATQQVNLKAPFVLSQAAIPYMVSKEWGRIVNVTSLWGVRGNKMDVAYCASKFGLDGLVASLAPELASKNVLVNSVAPGFIMTEAAEEAFTPEQLDDVCKSIPIGRLGKPAEIAELVAFLCSKKNTYMMGQNIVIDGGLTRTAFP